MSGRTNRATIYALSITGIVISYIAYASFTGDDSFIHFTYAKDIAEKFSYTFAGNRTYGATAPLWPVLVAIFSLTGIPIEIAGRVLSGIFGFLTVMLLAMTLDKRDYPPGIIAVAALALVLNTYYLRWQLTGMECTAAMFFILLAYHLGSRREPNPFYVVLSLSIGTLLRPETGLYLVLYLATFIRRDALNLRNVRRIILGLVPLLCWLVFAQMYFGHIIPSTFTAKVGHAEVMALSNFKRSMLVFVSSSLPELFMMAMVLAYGYIRSRTLPLKHGLRYPELVPYIFVAGFWAFYLSKNTVVLARYALITVPFIILALAGVIRILYQKAGQRAGRLALAAWALIIIAFNAAFTLTMVKPGSDRVVNGFHKEYKKMAHIIADYDMDDKSVMLSDVGLIGYYSGAKVYDFVGLVDRSRFGYKTDLDYFLDKKPDFLLLREKREPLAFLESAAGSELVYEALYKGLAIEEKLPRRAFLYRIYWDNQS